MTKNEGTGVSDSSEVDSGVEDRQIVTDHRSRYEKVYNFFGFNRAYNFPLWVICAGAMLGFSLSRLQDFNYDEIFAVNIIPGAMYYLGHGSYRVAMIMHLAGTLPAGVLMVLQFTPVIRHRFMLVHRINGYLVLLLLFMGNIGACMVLRHHDNGTRVATQTAEGMLVIMTTVGMALAIYNVKRLQIDQHRAWMLRTMFYFGTIVSLRIIGNVAAVVVTNIGAYYTVWSCDQIDFVYKQFGINGILESKYPQCLTTNGTLDGRVVVKAESSLTAPEGVGASVAIPFGASLWICIVLHVIGVEMYLSLTPRESARLRQVSYEMQLKAGFKNPGDAGLTAYRLGDADRWTPTERSV